ncbi:MAG: DinB family protein [Gemmatimonadota bacterium]|jgi:hypothetical protein
MPDLDSILAANRTAVDDLIATAEDVPQEAWTTPRAPGKWSPSQIVEHVAMALEEGGNVVSERPTKLPTVPFFLRPLAKLFLKRVLKRGRFPNSKTNKAMDPIAGAPTVEGGKRRLIEGLEAFERDCRARAAAPGDPLSKAFGRVAVEDYARFVELHTRHHTEQMPGGSAP